MEQTSKSTCFTLQEWTDDGPGKVLFNGTECTIGRGEDCDLVFLDDTYMSKKHAKISVIPDSTPPRFLIEDLGATNGVFVNEMKFFSHTLKQGAVIQCGKQKFHFSCEEPIETKDLEEEKHIKQLTEPKWLEIECTGNELFPTPLRQKLTVVLFPDGSMKWLNLELSGFGIQPVQLKSEVNWTKKPEIDD